MTTWNFIVILLIGFVDYLGIGLVYPVFAALLFDPNESIASVDASLSYRGAILGILIALTPLTQFLSSPILGAFSDYKGRKSTLLCGAALGCIGYFAAVIGIWTSSLTLLFLYRVLVGISGGTVAVAQAMIADISTEQTKAKRFALFNASLGIGFTIGPFLGGKLADPSVASWCGYAAPFIAAMGMSAVNLMMIGRFPETRTTKKSCNINIMEGLSNIRHIFLWRKLRMVFLATFAFAFGWSLFNEFVPVLLRGHFSFSTGDIGNYYAWGGVWYALCASTAVAPLLKYLAPQKIVVTALCGCAVCMLLFLAISDSSYIWWILPLFMFWMSTIYPTITVLVSNQASSDQQGEVLGVYQSVITSAMGLSPLLLGSVIGAYPVMVAYFGAFSMLLAGATFLIGCRAGSKKLSFS